MLNNPEEKSEHLLDKPLSSIVKPNIQTLLLILLLAAAVFTRLYILGARVMSHDEINHVYFAWQFYEGGAYVHNPLTHGPLQFHLLELSYFLFNVSDFSARLPAAIFSILTIMFIWQFRRYLGKIGALVAAALFTISPYMLYYGRYARNEAYAIFFTIATIWAVLRYLDTGKLRYFYLTGALAALHFATKETAFIFTAQLLIFLGLLFIYRVTKREWPNNDARRTFLIFLGLTLLLLIAMVAGIAIQHYQAAQLEVNATAAGEALTPPASSVIISKLPLAFGAAAGLAFLTAFIILLVGFGWRNLLKERTFDLMMFQLLLVFPQLSAFPAFWLKLPVSDYYTTESILKILPYLLGFLGFSLLIGVFWKWKEFLIGAGIYYGIFSFFFTTMFTNMGGLYTGLIGALGYWLEQQGVNRGSQPDYYFALVQLPIYEFLAVIGVICAIVIGAIWLWKRSKMEEAPPVTLIEHTQDDDEVEEDAQPAELPLGYSRIITVALLLFYSFTSLFAYSVAGEKMPWLTVHISWSMWLITGWVIGRIIERIDWKRVFTSKGAAVLIWFTLALLSFFNALGRLFGEHAPFQGKETAQLSDTNLFLMLVLVSVGCLIALIYTLQGWPKRQAWRFVLLIMIGFLAMLTARTAFTASYVNYDRANEYLVYAHAARGPKDALDQIEAISTRLTGGDEIKIAYDNHTMYPFWWYLRDYPNGFQYGENPTMELRDYPLILIGDGNYGKIDPIVRNDYVYFEYVRMIWPNQDYFNLSFYQPFFEDPATRLKMVDALFKIWLNRDFSLYGQITGENTSDRYWSPSQTFRLYVRKDVVYQIWEYGSSPGGQDLMVDPYAQGNMGLTPEKTYSDLGLNAPHGVAAAPDGSIYLADTNNNRILHINQEGIIIGMVGEAGSGPGQFNQPWGLAVDKNGYVFVADTWNHRIQKLSPALDYITSWGTYGQAESGTAFWGPRDVAIDLDGRVLVSDTGNKRVVVFEEDGTYVGEFGGAGYLAGQLEEPVGLAVSPVDNAVYVADTWNQRVQEFQASSVMPNMYVSTNSWDIDGWFGQSLENKPYLTIDELNNVIVGDPENGRVLVFSSDGTFIGYFGELNPNGSSGFGIVSGVAADGRGGVWVVDSLKNEIKYFVFPR